MSSTRRTLGDLDASCLNGRFNGSEKSSSRQKSTIQQCNENPFATKCKVARTPEASAVKKRKSLFMNVVQSSRDDFGVSNEGDQGGVTYDKILPERDEVVLTPVPISKRERNEISSSFGKRLRYDNVKEINRGSVNIFKDFAISSVELGMNNCEDLLISNKSRTSQLTNVAASSIQDNRDVAESSSSMEVNEIGSLSDGSSAAPGNIQSTVKIVPRAASPYECENDNNSVESDLDQLNIDEILQAFRDDAKAAERAIEMATICGRLHPKEFREYLRAFRSPPAKDLQRITESLTLQGSLERVERNKDTVWDISRTQSALLVSSSDQNNLLPICHRLGQQTFPSPKSSLLHFLEMADTPIAMPPSQDISSNIMNVDFASSEREVKSIICEVEFSAAKSAKINVVEVKHLSIKDRADEVRTVVAAAVASVLNIPQPQTTPSNTLPTQPTPLSIAHTQLPEVPEVAENLRRCSEDNFSQMKKEEGFHPKKVIMRTPPKVIEESVAATSTPIPSLVELSNNPIPEITVETISHDFLESTVIAENESVALLTRNSPKGFSEINEEISRKICEETSNISVAIPTISNYHDEWSVLELDRVDSVIRRVSMSVPDCPSAHTVMGQLKVEISRLKKEAATRHDELLAITADRQALLKRLDDVEVTTQKSCTQIAKYEEVAGSRSAAYRQGRIDAEIDAAKEVVDRLAAQKDIVLQKRNLRDIRLKEMDDEVAAEILSAKNRQLKRKESLSHQLPFIQESGAKNVLYVEIPPSNITAPSSPQNVPQSVTFSPSHSSSTFKQSFQPLLPSPECSFFKPLPIRPVPDMCTNFQPIDSKAFSGLKNGFTAFDKITKIKSSIQKTDQNTKTNNDIHNIEVQKNDTENNDKVTLSNKAEIEIKVVEEKAIESENLGDFDCQNNSTDMVCPTDNSYEQDINCNDIVDCNMSEFENNYDDIETEYPTITEHHTHDEKLIKETQKSDTNKRNGEVNDFRKNAEANKKPVTVNYYGNLKFVSLKVKSSKPRPLLEEEYSAMTSSTNCSDRNEDSDKITEHQDKKISHKNVERNVKKEKKTKEIDDLKKKKHPIDEKVVTDDNNHMEEVPEKEDVIVGSKIIKQQNVKKTEKNTKIIDKKIIVEKLPGKILKTKNEKISKILINKHEETSPVEDSVEDAIVNVEVEVGFDEGHNEETKSSPLQNKIVIIDKNIMNAKKTANAKNIEEDESEKENSGGNLQSVKIVGKNDSKNKINNGSMITIQPEKIVQEKMVHAEMEKESVRAVISAQFPAPTQNIRGATPYALFCATRKLEMKNKNILSSTTDLLKVISAEWKVLGLAEKEQWVTLGLTGNRESSVHRRDDSGVDKTHDVPQSSKSKNSKQTISENPVVEVVIRDLPPLLISKNNKDDLPDKKTQPIKAKAKKSGKILMDAIVEETIITTSENYKNDNTFGENETEILSKQKTKRKDQKRKKGESDNSDDLSSPKRGRSIPEKVEEEVPSSFDKKAEETLFSSSLSLSPVLAMPSSPVFLSEIPQGKKIKNKKSDNNNVEKVSRKRNILSSNDDALLPSSIDDNEIITNVLESNKLNNIMPPPKIPSKKMKTAAKTEIPKIDDVLFEDVFQAPKGFEGTVPKGGDKLRAGSKPDIDKPSGIGFGFSSSSSALNMSTSTVSSMFSTASTVRSKSQFVIPKLKKKG